MHANDTTTKPPDQDSTPPVRTLPVLVAALVGVALSVLAFVGIEEREDSVVRQEFNETAEIVLLDVEKSLDRSLLLTDALHSFFTHSRKVTRREFANFVDGTRQYLDGIQALQWVPRVPREERLAYEARAWADGLHGYAFKELDPQGRLVPAGPRAEYYPIYFLEPLAGNEQVLGFDVMSKPFSGQPRLKARDSGQMRVSGRISLIQETGRQFGFILFKPVYEKGGPLDTVEQRRKRLRGYIQLVLRGGDFLEAAMANTEHRGLAVYLHDQSAPPDEQFLHAYQADGMPYDEALTRLHTTSQIHVGGRTWRLTCVAKPEFTARFETEYAYFAGASGLVLTGLLCAYLLTLTGQARKTQALVERRTAELRESRERFDLALKGADLGLWDWNIATGEVIYDRRWAEMLEYSPEEIAPHVDTWKTLVHPHDMEHIAQPRLAAHFAGETPIYSAEKRMRAKSGRWKWILATGQVMERDEDGAPLRAVGTHMDVTDRKNAQLELERYKERLEMALVASEAGLWDWDIASDKVFYDSQWARILGYEREELPQTLETWTQAIHPDDQKRVARALERSLAAEFEGIFQVEYRASRKSGEWVWIMARGDVMRRDADGAPQRMIGTIQDITQRRLLEDELRQAKLDAEKANQAKSDFLANMSHEIRTPMNAVIGLTDLALTTALTPKQRDYLQKIRHSSKTLLGVINDILDFSKIEAGKLHLEQAEFRIADVFARISDMFADKMQRKDLEFGVTVGEDVPSTLVGDALRLEQVLVNLTGNAVKFTERGRVSVSVELENGDGGACEQDAPLLFTVADTGIGISEDKQATLFQAFTQADASTTRQYGGSGLGLSICKRLVEIMGGEIWVESTPEQGSTFRFRLTLPCGSRSLPAVTRSRGYAGLRALVVDDHETTREILCDMLEAFGFDTVQAHSAEAALSRVEGGDHGYALILADLRLPRMDGLEMSRRIKTMDLPAQPKIILVTAFGLDEALHGENATAADHVLLKPIQGAALLEAVSTVLPAPAGRDEPAPAPEHPLPPARVLLVEDNDINQQVASEILTGLGLSVDIAGDGQKALDKLADEDFDLVLMDVQMPVMDGYQATEAIRADERLAGLPVVAMTAHAMSGDREKCLAAGMDDYVAKPVEQSVLREVLAKWLAPAPPGETAAGQQPPPSADTASEAEDAVPEGSTPAPDAPSDAAQDKTHSAVLPDSLPGLDIAAGLGRLSGNARLLHKLYADFHAQYADAPRRIRTSVAAGDREEARRIAHTIKGVAGNLGATDVHETSAALEHALRHDEPHEAALEALEKALAVVIAGLAPLARDALAGAQTEASDAPSPAAQETARSTDAARNALDELAALVESRSFNAPAKAAQLRETLRGRGHDADLDALHEALARFDFTEAHAILGKLTTFPKLPENK